MPLNRNAGEPFRVNCDACGGRRFIEGRVCLKCKGDGSILITPRNLTVSQRAVRQTIRIFMVAAIIGALILAALDYFGVI
jgi:DnaJ-class molecular chaperone